MKVLHITPHLGGGVGTVILDWMERIDGFNHIVFCLDYANKKAMLSKQGHRILGDMRESRLYLNHKIDKWADIVLVHYWDHPMLAELFQEPLPESRMAFWCHKNFKVPIFDLMFPDRFIGTSPIQDHKNIIKGSCYEYIWSTGNMDRFLAIEPKPHEGFNIGTVVSPKLHPEFMLMCHKIGLAIPDAHFTILGESDAIKPRLPWWDRDNRLTFTGKVDDVAPYLAEMDVFAYPLRPDHYGTCEIALGEAMAAGVVPVVMDNPAEMLILGNMTDVFHSGLHSKNEEKFIENVLWLEELHELEILNRFSLKARKRAKDRYSIDNMIASWNKVFESMMQSPKTKRRPI